MEKLKNFLLNKRNMVLILIAVFAIGVISIIYVKNRGEFQTEITNFNVDASNEFANNSTNTNVSNNENVAGGNASNAEVEKKEIYVHIIGEVNSPNVYKLKPGQRVVDAIASAGGVTEKADLSKINLAYVLADGDQVRIPSVDDKDDIALISNESGVGSSAGVISRQGGYANGEASGQSLKVNINTANQSELETLDGVGPSIASKIIAYRNKNGSFKSIDELKEVSGIGEAKFEGIKEQVKLK